MKILIFEGVVTSGKSTITERIVKSLKDKISVELASEAQTHEPIMDRRDELHLQFFKDLINKLALKNPDLLIFDRLYITQAYRAKSNLSEYSSIEVALLPFSPHTIVLKVEEDALADRIKAAARHRGPEWEKFWMTKGDSYEEIARGYIEQQRGLLQLVEQSKIPHRIFNTTNHDYDAITEDILEIIR